MKRRNPKTDYRLHLNGGELTTIRTIRLLEGLPETWEVKQLLNHHRNALARQLKAWRAPRWCGLGVHTPWWERVKG